MRVESVAGGTLREDLAAWAKDRAKREEITPDELILRALAHERYRLKEGPRIDPRTRRVGVKGAAVQGTAQRYNGGDVARIVGTSLPNIQSMAKRGLLVSEVETRQGVAASYPQVECLVAKVLIHLEQLVIDDAVLSDVAGTVRRAPRVRGASVVVACDDAFLIGDEHLGDFCRAHRMVVAVSLETLNADIERALTRIGWTG